MALILHIFGSSFGMGLIGRVHFDSTMSGVRYAIVPTDLSYSLSHCSLLV